MKTKKIDTTPMTPAIAALNRLEDLLKERPAPRAQSDEDWYAIEAAYLEWRFSLGPRELTRYRAEQTALRAGTLEPYLASRGALVYDQVDKCRGRYHVRQRVKSGAHAERERARRAQAALASKLAAAPYDYGPDGRGRRGATLNERDAKAWKAPEALV